MFEFSGLWVGGGGVGGSDAQCVVLCSSCLRLIHCDILTQEMREVGRVVSEDPFLCGQMWQRQARRFPPWKVS